MEQRLIDANALMDALNVFKDRKNGNEHFMYGVETAKELLGIQMTVDAVPVVRCRECVHYETAGCKNGYGLCNARVVDSTGVYDDFYCADGERRSDEQQGKG